MASGVLVPAFVARDLERSFRGSSGYLHPIPRQSNSRVKGKGNERVNGRMSLGTQISRLRGSNDGLIPVTETHNRLPVLARGV